MFHCLFVLFVSFVPWPHEAKRPKGLKRPVANESQFLRNLFELIALDHVGHLILAEVAKPDPAFQAGAHFLYVVLETAQRRNPAVVNRLALSHEAGARSASDAAIGNQTTSDDAFA